MENKKDKKEKTNANSVTINEHLSEVLKDNSDKKLDKKKKMIKSFNSFDIRCFLCPKSKETYDFVASEFKIFPYENYISNENLYQVCCYSDDKLVGVRIFLMKEGKIHLNYTVVSESYRNKGINREMFDIIFDIASKNDISIITSNVRESNKASMKSLLASGFEVNDNVELFYPDGEKKIPFFKKLK